MTENPPEQDNQAAPEEKAETAAKVEEDMSSPESEEKALARVEIVKIGKAAESAPEEPVVESIKAEEVEPVEEAPYVPPSIIRNSRIKSMRDIVIGKVVVNITVGKSGDPLDKAMMILENLSDQKPVLRRAKQTVRTWGIRKNEPIACMVTLRRGKGENLLKKTFPAIGNQINPRSFDKQGNFAFGIREHIDIPGQRYDPNLGIVGMDIMATVERPGYRVTRKRRAKSRMSQSHRVTREESIEFIKKSFGVKVRIPDE